MSAIPLIVLGVAAARIVEQVPKRGAGPIASRALSGDRDVELDARLFPAPATRVRDDLGERRLLTKIASHPMKYRDNDPLGTRRARRHDDVIDRLDADAPTRIDIGPVPTVFGGRAQDAQLAEKSAQLGARDRRAVVECERDMDDDSLGTLPGRRADARRSKERRQESEERKPRALHPRRFVCRDSESAWRSDAYGVTSSSGR